MNISLKAKITTGFVVAVLFVFFAGAISWSNARRAEDTFRWVEHTQEILTKLEEVHTDILSLQTGARGFALTGLDHFLEDRERDRIKIFQNLEGLRQLVADNPAQSRQAEQGIAGQFAELLRWQAVMLDRSDRSLALKREVNELRRRLGEPLRSPSQEAGESGPA